MRRIAKFATNPAMIALFASLAIAGCASKKNLNSAADLGLGGAGAATPGSAQDFTVNVGDRIFFDTDSSSINASAAQTLDRQAQWLAQYPKYAITVEGHADERGEGPGLGYNLNLPLPRKSGDAAFLEALATAFRRIRAFAPEALVVALGLDAFEGDPFGGLSVTTPGFSRIGEAIAGLGLPTVIVQEGGYLCDALGDNLTAFLTGFGGKQR